MTDSFESTYNGTDVVEDPVASTGESIVLIAPPGTVAPEGFPFTIVQASDSPTDMASKFVEALRSGEVVAIEVPAAFAQIAIQLARWADVEIRALVGLEGEYPSYWQAMTSVLPVAVVQEIMLAQENSEAVGGTGVQPSKQPKATMKEADMDGPDRRADALKRLNVPNAVGDDNVVDVAD